MFVTDNQGGWLPASKLVQIKQDRFFNHYTNPAGPFDKQPVTQPVLWLPQNEIANSPSTPLYLTEGRFKGQMLFGDVTYGGLQRAYLEKVKGQYQGAVFRFTQGLEAGVNRISVGPDGAIYVGGLGADGNWGQEGKLRFGLQKLTPNGGNTFDIQAMRVRKGGFELEYTQPLSQETAEDLVSHYQAEQWRYTPTRDYGGPKIAEETLEVTSATLSADRRKVTLTIDGLKPGRVVHLRSPRPFSSGSGETLWSTEAWYTLNALPGAEPAPGPVYEAEEATLTGAAGINTDHRGYSGSGFVDRYGTPGATTTFDVTVDRAGFLRPGPALLQRPEPLPGRQVRLPVRQRTQGRADRAAQHRRLGHLVHAAGDGTAARRAQHRRLPGRRGRHRARQPGPPHRRPARRPGHPVRRPEPRPLAAHRRTPRAVARGRRGRGGLLR